jgi:hypothetical protein
VRFMPSRPSWRGRGVGIGVGAHGQGGHAVPLIWPIALAVTTKDETRIPYLNIISPYKKKPTRGEWAERNIEYAHITIIS